MGARVLDEARKTYYTYIQMLGIEELRTYCADETIVLTAHLQMRMRQRGISYGDLKNALLQGEIIEQYPDVFPFPACLISTGTLHTVCSLGDGHLYLITAYRPDPAKWESGGKIRKEKQL